MKKTKTTIGILAVVSTVALATVAFAHAGYGRHMGGYGGYMIGRADCDGPAMVGPGDDYNPRGRGYGAGYGRNQKGGAWFGMSAEDQAKLQAERDKFRSETKALRDAIDQKQLNLRQEMQNDEPDTTKAMQLQKELSQLRGEFDQKAIAHRIEMRKLLPEGFEGPGFGRGGYGRGYGGYCR